MVSQYHQVLKPDIDVGLKQRMSRYNEFDTNFRDFSANRSAGFCRQYTQIFIRNFKYLTGNKQAFLGVILNTLIISLLILSIFWHVGKFPDILGYPPTAAG